MDLRCKISYMKMKEALPLNNVPIEVDSNTGTNWLEAH